jgi:outer membrane immunogenic protein
MHSILERGVQMKKLLVGGVVALGMSAPAIAADMAARPIARPAAFTNWTGCYVGGGAGNSWGHHEAYSPTAQTTFFAGALGQAQVNTVTPFSQEFDMSGFTFGGYGGCQVQFGVWVVGAEGDWWGNNKEGQAFAVGPIANPVTILATGTPATAILNPFDVWSAKERWLATARGRLGYAVDKWLFYATGGAAWMKIDSAEFTITSATTLAGAGVIAGPVNSNLQSDTRLGWTVGGGVEYMLPYNWLIRSEYLFVAIPSYTTFTPGTNFPASTFFNNMNTGRLTNHIVRASLAYKFDFGGKAAPAVTK